MASIAPSVGTLAPVQSTSIRRGYGFLALATIVAATLANVIAYYLGDLVIGYHEDFLILSNPSGVAMFTAIAAVGAVLVYAALLRWTRNPVRNFNIISASVFVVTTVPEFTYVPGLEGSTNGQVAILVLTHIVAAAVIVPMLTSYHKPKA